MQFVKSTLALMPVKLASLSVTQFAANALEVYVVTLLKLSGPTFRKLKD